MVMPEPIATASPTNGEELDMPAPVATSTRPVSASADLAWWAMEAQVVAARLGTDLEQGLSSEEATHRLAATGPNTLPGEPPPARPLCRLLLRCTNTLIVLLLMIAVATAIVGDRTTTLAILAAALLNSIVSVTLRRRI
jgi:P-type Ca2+ transporter type 2C